MKTSQSLSYGQLPGRHSLLALSLGVCITLSAGGCGGSGLASSAREPPAAPQLGPGHSAQPDSIRSKDESAANASPAQRKAQAGSAQPSVPQALPSSAVIVDVKNAVPGGPAQYIRSGAPYGYFGDMRWTYVNGSSVMNSEEYHSGLGPCTCQVEVYIPADYATTHNARYRIESGGTVIAIVSVNQDIYYNRWISLGTFGFSAEPRVYLADDTGEQYHGAGSAMVGFDAVMFAPTGTGESFPQFRAQHNGQYIGSGQCVDLVRAYCSQVLGIAPFNGNADQYPYLYPHNHFRWIANTPTGVPQAGDIIVWTSAVGNGFGHTGVYVSGDVNSFQSYDQNWPYGSPCHVQAHTYQAVWGWLRFTG